MANFNVSLSVDIDADTHEEAARIFQGALPEYSILDDLTFVTRGYPDEGALEQTVEFIELPGRTSPTQVLDAIDARQNAAEA